VLAWLRRIVVSIGIGGASYALMLGIMVLSVVYDRELEPVITFAFDTGRQITNTLDSLVSGNYWGQVAVNHLRDAPFNKSYSLASRITYGAAQRGQSGLRVTVNSIDTIERRLSSAFALCGALCPLWVKSRRRRALSS
jgi:hypothetical protein